MLDRNNRPEHHGQSGPRWRVILEARWRVRLAELTELSLAYHAAAADASATLDRAADKPARQLLRRAVAARQRLADTEDALDRVAAGGFGRCEECGTHIAETLLVAMPEVRYCAGCAGLARRTREVRRPTPARRRATLVPSPRVATGFS
jgi:RNA polymerase-binding transcription factor DksA